MMMQPLLQWSDDYLVGIEELDIEHKDLINRLNQLHGQLARRHGDKRKIEGYLKEIYNRILAHFKLEERLMRDTDYPDYVHHKKEHDDFLKLVDDIISKYQTSPNYSFQDLLAAILQHWISNHITTSDHELGIHMKGAGDK
jgi:hemerythrin